MDKKRYSVLIAITVVVFLVVGGVFAFGVLSKDNGLGEHGGISNSENLGNVGSSNVGDSGKDNGSNVEDFLPPVVSDPELNVERDDEGKKINVSEYIDKKKMSFGDVDLLDISIDFIDGESTFSAKVKNNSEVSYPDGMYLKIEFLNEDKNLLFDMMTLTGSVEANGETNIYGKASIDFSNATYINLLKIK